MPNETRPCTLWGQTFDACEVSGVQASYHVGSKTIYSITINFWNGDRIESPQIKEVEKYTSKKVRNELNHIQALIYEALNAPVLATEKVLAGLPKDAKIYTIDAKTGDALKCTFDEEYGWVCRNGHFNEALALGKPYRIFTINDSKTAEYLRNFHTDGTPVKGKETE